MVAPTIHAVFETDDGECIGTTSAPVKRVERHDDGAFTVVIDHWPAPAVAPAAVTDPQVSEALGDARKAIKCLFLEAPAEVVAAAAAKVEWAFSMLQAARTPEPQAKPAALATDDVIAAMLRWYERNTGNAAEAALREEWKRAVDWLRNNYQDHQTVGDLCDAMLAAGRKQL